jgi:hypothetical protein
MYTVEKFKGDDGRVKVRIDLQSNTLPHVTIDTYQTFTGDSWQENEVDWLDEEYGIDKETAWRVLNFDYNHEGIRRGLAEASIEGILGAVYYDEIIESIEYQSSWSPQYYNFETDSYTATYTVDFDRLKQWYRKNGKDSEEWMRERWTSYDGFHSFMYPGYWEEEQYMEGMRVYATIAMYLQEVLNDETPFMHVAEAEDEIYRENVEISIREDDYEELVAEHIARVTGEEFEQDAVAILCEARTTSIEELMEKYPLDPRSAANALMEKPSEKPIPGQVAAF